MEEAEDSFVNGEEIRGVKEEKEGSSTTAGWYVEFRNISRCKRPVN